MPKGVPKKDGSGRGRGNRAKVVVGLLEREKVQISRVLKLKKQIELRVRTASNCVLLLNNWNRVCFS